MDTGTLVQVVSAAVSAGTTIVLAWLTGRYVRLTKDLVEEARTSKVPTVFVDLELLPDQVKFVIGNAGTSPALNITIEVIRDAEWTPYVPDGPSGLGSLPLVRRGIPYIAPGRTLKFLPGRIKDVAKFYAENSQIEIRLSYETEAGRQITREITFDLSSYHGVVLESFQDPQREVARALQKAGLLQSSMKG